MDTQPTTKKLYRSRTNKMIAGVCGGLGEYFEIDPLIFRIIFVVLLFAGGSGFWLYLILAIVIPKEPVGTANASSQAPSRNYSDTIRDNVHELAQDIKDSSKSGWLANRRAAIGAIIVIFGVIMLLDQLFPIHWLRWGLIWSILIIVLGIAILNKKD